MNHRKDHAAPEGLIDLSQLGEDGHAGNYQCY